jgi:hypothetical protein
MSLCWPQAQPRKARQLSLKEEQLFLRLCGALQCGDIQFFHFERGLQGLGMFNQVPKTSRNDLPGKPEFVFQTTTLTFTATGG